MVQLSHPTSNNAHEVLYFHFALGFDTQILAYTLDSLVRVSRRVITNHHLNIANTRVPPRPEVVQPPYDYIVLIRRSISWATLTEACYQILSPGHSPTRGCFAFTATSPPAFSYGRN